ncbi:uncharacterized protein LOC124630094 [Helicoverpa zea]|uniref:uncharacterized protein LOC124630094 n=1 Tax=Helicoverpa zea TaxID=7113 RepID=UPI001F591427|nr:uncharacterized protein LOC124630094 [Helicoverpa zea]
MVVKYVEVVMQLCSIGLVIAGAGLWAGAGVDARPRFRDEQTLVGGTIWSQIIIPIGLMISKIVEEHIDNFVQGFYLITGITLLWATGIVLIIHEVKCQRRSRRRNVTQPPPPRTHHGRGQPMSGGSDDTFDKVYYAIGVVCLVAGILKLIELVFILTSS